MKELIKKHWRYGGKLSHIGVEALPNGNDIEVEIQKIEWKDNTTINGKKQPGWICTFKPNPYFTLPMVLNATNRKRICRIAENNYPETIKDLRVILTKEMSNIPGESIKDWALRISATAPKPLDYESEVEKVLHILDNCKNLQDLQQKWGEVSYKSDARVVTRKDELKELLV